MPPFYSKPVSFAQHCCLQVVLCWFMTSVAWQLIVSAYLTITLFSYFSRTSHRAISSSAESYEQHKVIRRQIILILILVDIVILLLNTYASFNNSNTTTTSSSNSYLNQFKVLNHINNTPSHTHYKHDDIQQLTPANCSYYLISSLIILCALVLNPLANLSSAPFPGEVSRSSSSSSVNNNCSVVLLLNRINCQSQLHNSDNHLHFNYISQCVAFFLIRVLSSSLFSFVALPVRPFCGYACITGYVLLCDETIFGGRQQSVEKRFVRSKIQIIRSRPAGGLKSIATNTILLPLSQKHVTQKAAVAKTSKASETTTTARRKHCPSKTIVATISANTASSSFNYISSLVMSEDTSDSISDPTDPKSRIRRQSLPATAFPRRTSGSAVLQNNLTEARGLIEEIMNMQNLDPNAVSCLRLVKSLISSTNNIEQSTLPCIAEDGRTGEDINAQRTAAYNVLWSTVTSATGLPQMEPEPIRSRSSSLWKKPSVSTSPVVSTKDRKNENSQHKFSITHNNKSFTFDVTALENDTMLAKISSWDFPIFDLQERSSETILTQVAYTAFHKANLFRIFKIDKRKFFQFFHVLESGYWDIPYHNRVHAADVLQACIYLTVKHNPACDLDIGKCEKKNDKETCGSDSPTEDTQKQIDCLADAFSPLELMALYTAAAMHDVDHPGRTNAFLVNVVDAKAVLYNDRSVLENHHASRAWSILMQYSFVDALDASEYKRFRHLIIESILATDLAYHFDIINTFKSKLCTHGIPNWNECEDRFLTLKMLIKLADVNSPMRSRQLHRKWTRLIIEEFYQQGDDEKRRQIAISAYMDRHNPCVPKLQDRFISNLVNPLADALDAAGLLPYEKDENESDLKKNMKQNQKDWQKEYEEIEKV